ncbi:MAG: hypothetical protein M0R80_09820 [Proteobacteria bacterium]|jgi:hypothetical protein|nr:hypothetical protein [Pseudomonadota bacterium]
MIKPARDTPVDPRSTLKDVVKTIRITRGDLVFLNAAFLMINRAMGNPEFNDANSELSWIFSVDKAHPGSLTLPFIIPPLHKKHWIEYSEIHRKRSELWLKKTHPEMFDSEGNFIHKTPEPIKSQGEPNE